MKMSYNLVNSIIGCVKEAYATIVLNIEWVDFVNEWILSCKIVKTLTHSLLEMLPKNAFWG